MSNFVSENCHKVDSKELLQKTLQNFFIIILKISPSPPLRMCLPMITINYPVTLSISCENITKIHLTCPWYDPTSVTPYACLQNPTLSSSFLFHPWQICHATKEEHFLLAPTFHILFHQSSVLKSENLPVPIGYYINKHTGKKLCIIQTLLL